MVWSGINLIGHSTIYDNDIERVVLGRLIAWLAADPHLGVLPAPQIIRDVPDQVAFRLSVPVLEGTRLLWREAYSPDWRAEVVIDGDRRPVRIERAGPGLVLLPLPAIAGQGAVVELEYTHS
ncbi:MAG: hypothetical protein AB1449_06355 [Chloroflexota bacterium]